jgi:hypothetical protein
MSKDLVLKLFTIIDHHSWNELPSVFSKDIIYDRPGYETIEGIEKIIEFYSKIRAISSGSHNLNVILCENDQCACWGNS